MRLPAENDMFEPNTVFFGSKPALSHECGSRTEAELLYAVAEAGLRGPISLPKTEAGCRQVLHNLRERLTHGSRIMEGWLNPGPAVTS